MLPESDRCRNAQAWYDTSSCSAGGSGSITATAGPGHRSRGGDDGFCWKAAAAAAALACSLAWGMAGPGGTGQRSIGGGVDGAVADAAGDCVCNLGGIVAAAAAGGACQRSCRLDAAGSGVPGVHVARHQELTHAYWLGICREAVSQQHAQGQAVLCKRDKGRLAAAGTAQRYCSTLPNRLAGHCPKDAVWHSQ